MRLVRLDSELWERYPGAQGSVRREVAVLMGEAAPEDLVALRRLDPEQDPERTAFETLCENLSHQMTFYPAMYLALPYFVKLLGRKAGDFAWQLSIFSEAGLCLAADVPWDRRTERDLPPELPEAYREAAEVLAGLAEGFLKKERKRLRREDSFERRRLCLGLYGLLGDRREAFAMAMNRFETCYVQCGQCGYLDEELELVDWKQRRKLRPLGLLQKGKPPAFLRFRRVLHEMGDWEGEELLACYYGVYTCPRCHQETPVMEGLTAAFDPELQPPVPPEAPEKRAPGTAKPVFAPASPPRAPDILEDNALRRAVSLCREDWPQVLPLLDGQRYQEAAAWCAQKARETPDWRLRVLEAYCYNALGKAQELDQALSAALDLDPDNVLVLRARCPTVSTTNRYRRHIQDLTRLMDLDPAHRPAYLLDRAYRFYWTGDSDAARQDLIAAEAEGGSALLASPDRTALRAALFPEEGPS